MSNILSVILVILGFISVFAGILLVHLKRRKNGIVLFLVYSATYIPFSISGRYVIANHGGNDWRKEWCPHYIMYEYRIIITKIGTKKYGIIYWPCILFDRYICLPTQWDVA